MKIQNRDKYEKINTNNKNRKAIRTINIKNENMKSNTKYQY